MSQFPVYSANTNMNISFAILKAGVDGSTFAASTVAGADGANVIKTLTRTGEGVYTFVLARPVATDRQVAVFADVSRATPISATVNASTSISSTTGVATVTVTNYAATSAADFVENDYIKILIVRDA